MVDTNESKKAGALWQTLRLYLTLFLHAYSILQYVLFRYNSLSNSMSVFTLRFFSMLTVFFSTYCSDTTRSQTQCRTNNTSVCLNPDTILYVFFSMYLSDTTRSQTQYPTNNTSVCINSHMTIYVFFSMYSLDTTRSQTQYPTNNTSVCLNPEPKT